MNVRTISTVGGFKNLEPVWRELHAQSPDSSFFNSFDFAFVWWQLYGSLGELAIYVVEIEAAGGDRSNTPKAVAIAPMYKTSSRLTRLFELPTLRFIGRGGEVTPDDLDVLLSADDADATTAALQLTKSLLESGGIQRILLEDLPASSRFFKLCSGQLNFSVERRESRRTGKLPNSWAEFTQTLSRNTRKRIKHRRNRLHDKPSLSLSFATGRQAMLEALKALETLHQLRHEHKEGECAFHTAEYGEFHRALIDAAHDTNTLKFVVLKDDEKVIGVEYTFVHAGSLLFYQTGFDPGYDAISPGHNMMVFALEQAINEGLTEFDLLKGDYEYKRSYAFDTVESLTVSDYRLLRWRLLAKVLTFVKSF